MIASKLKVERLAEFPEMGRPGRIEGTRELIVTRAPYVVAYSFTREAVTILRILHGAQLWPIEF
jgi:addiction module RelE/StbE family toxin